MNPVEGQPGVDLLLGCIQQVSLDVTWSISSSTVEANKYQVLLGLCLSDQVNLSRPYEHFGPLPHVDHCGYEVAIQMVIHSRIPGRQSKDHTQFDTAR